MVGMAEKLGIEGRVTDTMSPLPDLAREVASVRFVNEG